MRIEDFQCHASISRFFDIMQFMAALPLVQCCAPIAEPGLTEAEASELERVFKALADRHRVKILNRLLQAGGEAVCVCDLEDLLPLKQPTVSYHLKQLLQAGIVEREKRGSFAYFSVSPGALEHVCSLLGYDHLRSST
jgi:ArsR family transcriptional regulator